MSDVAFRTAPPIGWLSCFFNAVLRVHHKFSYIIRWNSLNMSDYWFDRVTDCIRQSADDKIRTLNMRAAHRLAREPLGKTAPANVLAVCIRLCLVLNHGVWHQRRMRSIHSESWQPSVIPVVVVDRLLVKENQSVYIDRWLIQEKPTNCGTKCCRCARNFFSRRTLMQIHWIVWCICNDYDFTTPDVYSKCCSVCYRFAVI